MPEFVNHAAKRGLLEVKKHTTMEPWQAPTPMPHRASPPPPSTVPDSPALRSSGYQHHGSTRETKQPPPPIHARRAASCPRQGRRADWRIAPRGRSAPCTPADPVGCVSAAAAAAAAREVVDFRAVVFSPKGATRPCVVDASDHHGPAKRTPADMHT
jgi:hypothetical protein